MFLTGLQKARLVELVGLLSTTVSGQAFVQPEKSFFMFSTIWRYQPFERALQDIFPSVGSQFRKRVQMKTLQSKALLCAFAVFLAAKTHQTTTQSQYDGH